MSTVLSTLRQLLRRSGSAQWSRLERDLGPSALPAALVSAEQHADPESGELRNYLAAQTSQVV